MKTLTYTICLFLLVVARGYSQSKQASARTNPATTLLDELQTLYDVSILPAYREGTTVAQTSTYDRTGGNDDGFDGTYSFVSRNADSSLVLFDQKGTGVVNRIWTPTPTKDTLDFYIDSPSKPTLSICYKDLFSGKVFPFVEPLCGNQLGGYFCYFPILFQQSCKIVCRGKRVQFHQIQYRLYTNNSRVKPFTTSLTAAEKNALKRIKSLWTNDDRSINDFVTDANEVKTQTITVQLKPGQTKPIFELNQGGRLIGIELTPASAFEGLTKAIDLKINWDDEKQAAVYCPVADFFGYAFGKSSMRSVLLGSLPDRNYCFFPMPFDRKATVELLYREAGKNRETVDIQAKIYYTMAKRNPQTEGKFYTHWQRGQPPAHQPHVFLQTQGKGHYVGTLLQAQGLRAGMTYFFEGDDSTIVDGQLRMHGTGSEDYFNGGWYAFPDRWDTRYSLPIHGSLDYNLPLCRTGGYRFYLSDKISFKKSIFHSIEHGPKNNDIPVDYTSVSFYYSDRPASQATTPTSALTSVYLPDTLTIYPQLVEYTIWDNIDVASFWAYNTGGKSFMYTVNNESQLRFSLTDIPAGNYQLYGDFTAYPDGCNFSVWQRQTQLSDWISTYEATKKRVEQQYLCDISVDDLKNSLTLHFTSLADKKKLFLNRFILVRKP